MDRRRPGRPAREWPGKATLRRELRAARRHRLDQVPDRDVDRFAAHRDAVAALTPGDVYAFQPMPLEPDIRGLLLGLAGDGRRILLPRTASDRLEWVPATPDHLTEAPKGLPRPDGTPVVVGATEIAAGVLLVPALAVDPANGHRLGQGAGYYDRLLGSVEHEATVAVVFSQELLPLAVEPHDRPVAAVLTEEGLRRVDPKGRS